VVAPATAEARLSAWTWSRGTTEIAPFGRYLLHVGKVRYQLRVRGDGRAIHELRRTVDDSTCALTGALDRVGAEKTPAGELTALPDLLRRLRSGEAQLVRVSTALGEMRRSVEIARWNMGEVLRRDGPGEAATGLFGDDAGLVDWFAHQLADDRAYLDESRTRARRVGEIAEALADPRTAASAASTATTATHRRRAPADIPITDDDREALLHVLADIFGTEATALPVFERIGLEPGFRRAFRDATPLETWRQLLTDMRNGRLPAPHRSLIEAGLHEYPFNDRLLALAARYGVPDVPRSPGP
jgi:hypothetical protein